MGERLVCDRCGATYADRESIDMAQKFKDEWAQSCKADGVEPRGLCGCPRMPCEGELVLKEK